MGKQCPRLVVFVLAWLGAAVWAGFAQGEEKMPVFLMSEKGETRIEARAGETFALRFRTTPGTGYSWAFAAEPDARLLEFLGEELEESERGRIGGSVFAVWTFRALAAGETEIRLKYARPWEKESPPAREHVFQLKIQ